MTVSFDFLIPFTLTSTGIVSHIEPFGAFIRLRFPPVPPGY